MHACTIRCGLLLIVLVFLKIGQMVICPVRDTYNHETNLNRVNSMNNICFNFKIDKSTQTRQFLGDTANACTKSGSPLFTLLFSLKICRIVVCRVRGTYIHVWIFFCSKMKKNPLKLAVEQNLEGKMLIFLPNYSVLSENINFTKNCQMVTCTIGGRCHHETNLA